MNAKAKKHCLRKGLAKTHFSSPAKSFEVVLNLIGCQLVWVAWSVNWATSLWWVFLLSDLWTDSLSLNPFCGAYDVHNDRSEDFEFFRKEYFDHRPFLAFCWMPWVACLLVKYLRMGRNLSLHWTQISRCSRIGSQRSKT